MATLYWQRDIASDVSGVKNTFSGWDQCMAKSYCKWPVIAGIIIGSLIALSVVWCLVKILCLGAECCFCLTSCARCCTCCCRDHGSSKPNRGAYQQPPAAPYQQPYQYQSQPPPHYGAAAPQYARFDAPSGKTGYRGAGGMNEDALPAMPSWDNAASRKIEDHSMPEDEGVELDKFGDQAKQPMLPQVDTPPLSHQNSATHAGDLGMLGAAGAGAAVARPYHDSRYQQNRPSYISNTPSASTVSQQPAYGNGYGGNNNNNNNNNTYYQPQNQYQSPSDYQRQATASPYGHSVSPPSMSHAQSPPNNGYLPSTSQPSQQAYMPYGQQYQPVGRQESGSTYAPSVAAPPSYRTQAPSMNAGQGQPAVGRKPVQGSWRDL